MQQWIRSKLLGKTSTSTRQLKRSKRSELASCQATIWRWVKSRLYDEDKSLLHGHSTALSETSCQHSPQSVPSSPTTSPKASVRIVLQSTVDAFPATCRPFCRHSEPKKATVLRNLSAAVTGLQRRHMELQRRSKGFPLNQPDVPGYRNSGGTVADFTAILTRMHHLE